MDESPMKCPEIGRAAEATHHDGTDHGAHDAVGTASVRAADCDVRHDMPNATADGRGTLATNARAPPR